MSLYWKSHSSYKPWYGTLEFIWSQNCWIWKWFWHLIEFFFFLRFQLSSQKIFSEVVSCLDQYRKTLEEMGALFPNNPSKKSNVGEAFCSYKCNNWLKQASPKDGRTNGRKLSRRGWLHGFKRDSKTINYLQRRKVISTFIIKKSIGLKNPT